MKILLTGSTGFVGRSLQKKLDSHLVILTSRSDKTENSSRFFRKTISSIENFSDCLNDVEVVIHTAARVHQMNDLAEDPLTEFMETNCSVSPVPRKLGCSQYVQNPLRGFL